MKKLIIIGQGPAGISAALYAVRGGADVTVVAKGEGALAKAHARNPVLADEARAQHGHAQ